MTTTPGRLWPREWARVALLLVVAAAAACNGGDTDTNVVVGDCTNGERDGDETAIDCGGACGATCGLGEDCASGDDCTFGLCDDVCTAPTDGPAPTGEVSATVPADGGTLTVVTDEGVTVTLSIPAGALAAPTAITLTPQPVGREWVRLLMDPPGMVFDTPVPVAVTLPASVPAAADGMIGFAGTGEQILVATTSGATLTADLDFLGLPGFVAPPSTARGLPSPTDILMAVPVNFNTRIALADNLLTAFEFTHRYRDALELNAIVTRMLQDGSHPEWDSRVEPFLHRAWNDACSGLADARSNMVAHTNPQCIADAKRFERPVLDWVSLMQKIEGYAPSACAGFSDDVWKAEVEAHQVRIPVPQGYGETMPGHPEVTRVAFLTCECEWTPKEEWSFVQQFECPRFGFRDVPTEQGDWDLFVDGVERANQMALLDRFVGLDAGLAAGVIDPYVTTLRAMVYDGCHRDASTVNPGKLLAALTDPSPFRTDAQYCASTLAWEARDSGGDPKGTGAIGGGEDPGEQQTTAAIAVTADGTLVLNGPIAALTCPEDPVRVETEELVIEAVGSTRAEVARLTPSGGLLLAENAGLALDVGSLFTAAGLDPDVDSAVTLEVTRAGPACGGLYGADSIPLFQVEARLPGMKARMATEAPFTAESNNCTHWVDPYPYAYYSPNTLPTACSVPGLTTSTLSWVDPSTVAFDATLSQSVTAFTLATEFSRPGTLTVEVSPWGTGMVRFAVAQLGDAAWIGHYDHKGTGALSGAPAPLPAFETTVPIEEAGTEYWLIGLYAPEGSGTGRVLTLHFE